MVLPKRLQIYQKCSRFRKESTAWISNIREHCTSQLVDCPCSNPTTEIIYIYIYIYVKIIVEHQI